MENSSSVIAVQSGRIDFAASLFTITEERKQSINFTDPYYVGGAAIGVFGSQTQSSRPTVENSRLGVMTGSTNEIFAETNYPNAQLHRFNNYADSSAALLGNKLDYAMMDYTSAINFTRNNPQLEIVSDFLTDEWLCLAVNKNNPELHRQISEIVDRYLQDGTMDKILANWLRNDGSDYVVPDIPQHENAPALRMAIVSSREPTTFMLNGRYAGTDIELMERIAYELGYKVEYLDMEWGGVISALGSDRADVALGMYSTPERQEQVLFTSAYLANPQVLIAQKVDEQSIHATSFWQNLKTSFQRNLIHENRWKMIVEGLKISMIITLFAFVLATLLYEVCQGVLKDFIFYFQTQKSHTLSSVAILVLYTHNY
jgi:polar amino acid transport system substrate-binding protein